MIDKLVRSIAEALDNIAVGATVLVGGFGWVQHETGRMANGLYIVAAALCIGA